MGSDFVGLDLGRYGHCHTSLSFWVFFIPTRARCRGVRQFVENHLLSFTQVSVNLLVELLRSPVPYYLGMDVESTQSFRDQIFRKRIILVFLSCLVCQPPGERILPLVSLPFLLVIALLLSCLPILLNLQVFIRQRIKVHVRNRHNIALKISREAQIPSNSTHSRKNRERTPCHNERLTVCNLFGSENFWVSSVCGSTITTLGTSVHESIQHLFLISLLTPSLPRCVM